MKNFARLAAAAALIGGLAFPAVPRAQADIGPRRPISTREVSNPEQLLAMRDETVDVTIDRKRATPLASVTARFHFEPLQETWRQTLIMRLGFPQLNADKPLMAFQVWQQVYRRNASPPTLTGDNRVSESQVVREPARKDDPSGLAASWWTWPLTFQGHYGAPSKDDVAVEVKYMQALTPAPNKTWRYTYVLRSGAPWRDPIGAATVRVRVDEGSIVSASPAGGKVEGSTVTWTMSSFEPTQDIVVVVR